MLNAGYKKEALKKCEEASEKYKKEYESTIKKSTELHEDKEKAVKILKDVDTYIHSLSNKPKEIEKIATEVSVRRKAFEKEVEKLEEGRLIIGIIDSKIHVLFHNYKNLLNPSIYRVVSDDDYEIIRKEMKLIIKIIETLNLQGE